MWVGALGILVFGGPFLFWDALVTMPLHEHLQTAAREFGNYLKDYLGTWPFFLCLGVVFTLEATLPASRSQRLLSTGLRHDFVLAGPTLLYWFFALPFFLAPLSLLLQRYSPSIQVVNLGGSPAYISWPLAFLLQDLLLWVSHYLRHKIPLLWHFHALHHSQMELNMFSEFRAHPLDLVASQLLIGVPLYMIAVPAHTIVALLIGQKWFLMLLHANVRTNLGILGHLVVSPVFHRLHHSSAPQHTDVNFGVYLSIWDRLFGTRQDPAVEEPFATGVMGYPIEQECRWQETAGVYVRQLLYPFEILIKDPSRAWCQGQRS
ncbi:MAG: sterol desaturase family protein [Deltaproteobacteria bacterium]|nr:sterol desaturase family protein [Deltaproteobacteria bacterium]